MSKRSIIVTTVLLSMLGGTGGSDASDDVRIEVLSNRADLISGGDVLVAIDSSEPISVHLNGDDVTAAFSERDDRLVGLVTGLRDGPNELAATTSGGGGASLEITNHPIGGPVFSGPQVQPWVCTTLLAGLGEPLDAQCNAPPVYDYQYWSTEDDTFAAYDPASPPSDVAETTTDEGETVPFIVRRETGALNRGVHAIAVLWDMEGDAPIAWNHKMLYPFGGACNSNHNQSLVPDVLDERVLGKGFLIATSSLNALGNNCNTVTSAETVMMLKEHIVERYGLIRYAIGRGGSGGAIGQLATTNQYPGMLQGLIPDGTFPDTWTTAVEVLDCHLLFYYFARNPHLWASLDHQTAVGGHGEATNCPAWEVLFAHAEDPTHGCGLLVASPLPSASVPVPTEDYHPILNRRGCRATIQDLQVGVWGRRNEDGFARFVWDNVGVQYGLRSFQEAAISAEQFVHLNENVGTIDIDFNLVPGRREADPGTPLIAHRTANVNDGRHLAGVAILDLPATGNNEIHTPYHAWSIDERLRKSTGTSDNHVKWMGGNAALAFDTMDAWLAAVETDHAPGTLAEKVIRNKPVIATNSCFISGTQLALDSEQCKTAYPVFGDARMVAGETIASDTMKCALKPLVRSGYVQELTDDQFARLQAVFPNGVCDFSVPGVGEVPSEPWMSYSSGPGGVPLGPPPVSQPL